MRTGEPATEAESSQEWVGYYTPSRIVDAILRRRQEWQALAETPSTARHLLERGPTHEDPRIARQRGHHSDPFDMQLSLLIYSAHRCNWASIP